MSDDSTGCVLWGLGGLAAAFVVGFLLILMSGAQVDAGHVGVVGSMGAIDKSQTPLGPGFHVVMPFFTHIDSVSVQPQNHQFREVAASSKELQNVYVDGGVNYHIDSNRAAELQIEGGIDAIVSKIFDPAFQDYIKEVVPTYVSAEILAQRAKIRDSVKQKLSEKALSHGIVVDDVFITNIHFDKGYEQAIASKAAAQQQLEQAKVDADRARTVAQGEADANRIKQQSITPELIQYTIVQKWNGVLPQATSGNPFLVIGSSPTGGH